MAQFKIFAKNKDKNDTKLFYYDNMTSALTWEDGTPIYNENIKERTKNRNWGVAPVNTPQAPLSKSSKVKVLKIQLGLSCNYSCEYCSQRFVPHSDETNSKYVDKFVQNLDLWMEGAPQRIEFWGGEPLVYVKTIKPLAEKLKEKFPKASFLMITNGSLLNPEINEWIDKMGFGIGLSHDGPGQPVRGPDPLDNEEQKKNIDIDLYDSINHYLLIFSIFSSLFLLFRRNPAATPSPSAPARRRSEPPRPSRSACPSRSRQAPPGEPRTGPGPRRLRTGGRRHCRPARPALPQARQLGHPYRTRRSPAPPFPAGPRRSRCACRREST